MRWCALTALCCFASITFQQVINKQIRIGLLFSKNSSDSDLAAAIGYQCSASAVLIGLDRIRTENLLPGYDFTLKWYFDECEQQNSVGYFVELIETDKVDVVIGPSCPASAMMASTVASYYNFPIFVWGMDMPGDISNPVTYPTASVMSPTTLPLVNTLMAMINHFQWTEFAFIYTLNRSSKAPRCSYIQSDVEVAAGGYANISLIFKKQITSLKSNETMSMLMETLKKSARIIVGCLESDDERRDFMKAVAQYDMHTDEYVYIFLEMRREGFGDTPFWIQTSGQPDGLDEKIHAACSNLFVIDSRKEETDNNQFFKEVIARMKDPPFYCTTDCASYTEAGSRSPLLAEAAYLYGLALNRTLAVDPVNAMKDGVALLTASAGTFEGYWGTVVIDEYGNRQGIYNIFGLNKNGAETKLARITTYRSETSWESLFASDEESFWSTYGGVQPRSTPLCGFSGVDCPLSFFDAYGVFLIVGIILVVLALVLLIAIVICVLRAKRKEKERLDQLWQINFVDLVKPAEKSEATKSLRSINSTSTRATAENLKETDSYVFFYLFNEAVVARKYAVRPKIEKADTAELRLMRRFDYDNLNKFLGLCVDGPQYLAVWKFCSRGSLSEVIEKGSITIDSFFAACLMKDICEGLYAIHHSLIGHHGYLTSSDCLIDDRWQVKINNFGLRFMKNFLPRPEKTLLWTAPEHLREGDNVGSKPGDVYSFAIICSEIITKKSAFNIHEREESVEELVFKIKRSTGIPFRPVISMSDSEDVNPSILNIVRDCWDDDPKSRPNIDTVRKLLKSASRGGNLMDHVFSMMEAYATNLEEEVNERTKELVEEKKKSDILLYRMLPKQVAEQLKLGQSVEPESFEGATVFFSDVVKFAALAAKCKPFQVVNFLNDLYTTFDAIIDEHQVYKVETIGDGYLCVSGVPRRNGNEHARDIAEMSFAFLRGVHSFRIPHLPDERVHIRVGVNTGPCVAGVVGLSMPRYCLFGDTINTASRMESNGKPGHIHITSETNRYLTELIGGYDTESRGEIIIKGKGVMETFWLWPKGVHRGHYAPAE